MPLPRRYPSSIRLALVPIAAAACLGMTACAGTQTPKTEADTDPRPNVLVIVADDLGWGDVGVLGSEVPTPNIDRLANQGALFTNFHTAATCSPSRAMLLTGVDSHLAGLGNMGAFMSDNQRGQPGYEGYLNRRVRSLGELFEAAGYVTGFFGKWHLGDEPGRLPHDRGFRHTFALLSGSADNWSATGSAPIGPVAHFSRDGALTERPKGLASALFTDELLHFLAGPATAQNGRPFLAVLSFQAVHWPHHAPDDALARHRDRYHEGWDTLRKQRHERLIELGLLPAGTPMRDRDPRVPAWSELDAATRRTEALRMSAYAAMLDDMDREIGRALDALDADGRARDTIVVFVSDNGPDQSEPDRAQHAIPWYTAQYPETSDDAIGRQGSFPSYGPQWAQSGSIHLRDYKGAASEGGMRVPFIIRYPARVAGGQRIDAFGFAPDLVPTLLEASGMTHPARGQNPPPGIHAPTGHSAWPVLLQHSRRIHPDDEAIGYELMTTAALFQGDYKLLRNGFPTGDGEWMLFHLASDPGELHDLRHAQPERFEQMRKAFDAYAERVGVVPVPDEYDVFKMLTNPPSR